jgi:serine/threonine protein kinase/tetratricopeptide (TPR) repeat protein
MATAYFSGKRDTDELPASSLVDNSYRIVRMIGKGGMGAVYEAEDIRLGRPVALKVLRSDLASQLQADERFVQEAKILARIRSPFMATVFAIGATEQGRTYIAMEYIDGESLGDLLDRERWLPVHRMVRIGQRVCEALMEAHKVGIIHRDLKPDNILLTKIGSVDDYVKVVDLGLAKHMAIDTKAEFQPRLTQARLVVGTPAYMSPEQAAGHDVGPSSDLYSLGVICYEMLCGFLPVDGETPQDFLRAHQLQPPVPLAKRRSDLSFPPQIDAFFARVLAKNIAERPADARAFAEELEKLEASLRAPQQPAVVADMASRLEGLNLMEPPPLPSEERMRPATPTTQQRPSVTKKPTTAREKRESGPTLNMLDDRLDRAKDRVRLEMVGLVSRSRAALYDAMDSFATHLGNRSDAPVIVRMHVTPPEGRLPIGCFFDEIRSRAGLFDDDSGSMARRKLLAWVQGLMPDRPDRASQVAHLIGLYLRVEFPDSPHLSHARAVPEVARQAACGALVDALRAIAGRNVLVLLLDRAEHLTETETAFLRRLIRQLGATPVMVVAGWVAKTDDVPAGLAGTLAQGAVAAIPSHEPAPLDLNLLDTDTRRVLSAAVQLGGPLWPDMLEAATGTHVTVHAERLVRLGALRQVPTSRLSNQVEYVLAEVPDATVLEGQPPIQLRHALHWLQKQAEIRVEPWTPRLAVLEAAAGAAVHAAEHGREAADLMRALGALPEAIGVYETSRQICRSLRESPDATTAEKAVAAHTLATTSLGLSRALGERGDCQAASDRAREAIEILRALPGLSEDDWYARGVPLLNCWAEAETHCGRAQTTIAPLEAQLTALSRSTSGLAATQLAHTQLALGRAIKASAAPTDKPALRKAVDAWTHALGSLTALHEPVMAAALAMELADAWRTLGEGEKSVTHARRALSAARDVRNLILEVEALRALALALRDIGELDDAEAQLGEALNALGRLDRQRLAAEVLVLLATVLQTRGAIDEADAALAKACRAFAALPDLAGLSDALRQRGDIQMAHGIYTRAKAFADEAARQAVLANHDSLRLKALLLTARAAAAAGEPNSAHTAMEDAFQLVPSDVPTAERAECMVVLADLIEAGVLTSDRQPQSLLSEAEALYRDISAVGEAQRLARRLRAMNGLNSQGQHPGATSGQRDKVPAPD